MNQNNLPDIPSSNLSTNEDSNYEKEHLFKIEPKKSNKNPLENRSLKNTDYNTIGEAQSYPSPQLINYNMIDKSSFDEDKTDSNIQLKGVEKNYNIEDNHRKFSTDTYSMKPMKPSTQSIIQSQPGQGQSVERGNFSNMETMSQWNNQSTSDLNVMANYREDREDEYNREREGEGFFNEASYTHDNYYNYYHNQELFQGFYGNQSQTEESQSQQLSNIQQDLIESGGLGGGLDSLTDPRFCEEDRRMANQSTCCDDTDFFKVPCCMTGDAQENEENEDLFKANLLDIEDDEVESIMKINSINTNTNCNVSNTNSNLNKKEEESKCIKYITCVPAIEKTESIIEEDNQTNSPSNNSNINNMDIDMERRKSIERTSSTVDETFSEESVFTNNQRAGLHEEKHNEPQWHCYKSCISIGKDNKVTKCSETVEAFPIMIKRAANINERDDKFKVDYSKINDLNYMKGIVEKSLVNKMLNSLLTQPGFICGLSQHSYSQLMKIIHDIKYVNIYDISFYALQTYILRLTGKQTRKPLRENTHSKHVTLKNNNKSIHSHSGESHLSSQLNPNTNLNSYSIHHISKDDPEKEKILLIEKLKTKFRSLLLVNITKTNYNQTVEKYSYSNSSKLIREANIRKQSKTYFNKILLTLVNALFVILFDKENFKLNTLKFNDPHRKNNIKNIDLTVLEILTLDNPQNKLIKTLFNMMIKGEARFDYGDPFKVVVFQILHALLTTPYSKAFQNFYSSKMYENLCMRNIKHKLGSEYAYEFHFYSKSFINYIKEEM